MTKEAKALEAWVRASGRMSRAAVIVFLLMAVREWPIDRIGKRLGAPRPRIRAYYREALHEIAVATDEIEEKEMSKMKEKLASLKLEIQSATEMLGTAYASSWEVPGANAVTSRLHASLIVCRDAIEELNNVKVHSTLPNAG